jgi:hypothetical protein
MACANTDISPGAAPDPLGDFTLNGTSTGMDSEMIGFQEMA